ncbi:MAG: hypothetical protein JNL11_03580 [Bdellovibrionaceae bacterium]|nr:hypothetical protein [Pseudobdellovibrionaceae bacterium]
MKTFFVLTLITSTLVLLTPSFSFAEISGTNRTLYSCYESSKVQSLPKQNTKADFVIMFISNNEILTDGIYLTGPKPIPVEQITKPNFDKSIKDLFIFRNLFISLKIFYHSPSANFFSGTYSDVLRDVELICREGT